MYTEVHWWFINELKDLIVGKLQWCKRNKTLQGVLLKENNQLLCGTEVCLVTLPRC